MTPLKKIFISLFVVVWLVLFNYESTRHFYLTPLFGRTLPKLPLLFPPAGWIMFFQVGDREGHVQVYGVKDGVEHLIDPHDILETRAVLYDNIHRNVMINVLYEGMRPRFCRFLKRKFPE